MVVDEGSNVAAGPNLVADFVSGVDKLVFAGVAGSASQPQFSNGSDGLHVTFAGQHVATLLGVDSSAFNAPTDVVSQSASVVSPLMNAISDVNALQQQLSVI